MKTRYPGNWSLLEAYDRYGLMRSFICVVVTFLTLVANVASACTTVVVSGSVTADGRPLLWKNRDSSSIDNVVIIINKPGLFRCAVVTDKGVGDSSHIWMGVNEKGLCIENALSRDLHEEGFSGAGNGGFMRKVLESCSDMRDLEKYLEETNGARLTQSSFGVIDRHGGAAIFETGPSAFKKYDANDPGLAPHGFIVRSNFSFVGQGDRISCGDDCISEIYSGERYLSARNQLLRITEGDTAISLDALLKNIARDLSDKNGVVIPGSINNRDGVLPEVIDTSATVARRSTVSSVVFHGVLPNEDPLMTTMWVTMGQPTFSVAVPVWSGLSATSNFLSGPDGSPLCSVAIELSRTNHSGEDMLLSIHLPTIWERNLLWETGAIQRVDAAMEIWRQDGVDTSGMMSLHSELTRGAYDHLTLLKSSLEE